MMKKRIIPILCVLVLLVLIMGVNLVQGMTGTIVLTNADGSNYFTMTSSSPLNTLVNQVASRIKVAMSNELTYQSMTAPPSEFSGQFNSIADRIKIQFANGVRYNSLPYPKDLIDDTANPFVVETSDSGMYLYITANELSTMMFQYGFTPGSYPDVVINPLFEKVHTVPLSLFPDGVRVYFRVTLVDRSGNQSLSQEYVFVPPTMLYLPYIKR